jgi:hypothetical protein
MDLYVAFVMTLCELMDNSARFACDVGGGGLMTTGVKGGIEQKR